MKDEDKTKEQLINELCEMRQRIAQYEALDKSYQVFITKRKQVEEAMRKSEEQYRLIFHNSPLGIMHFDQNGTVIACNNKLVEILGSSRESLIGFNMVLSLQDKALRSAVLTALSGKIGYYEDNYLSVTGNKLVPIKVVFNRITSEDGTFLGAVGIWEDITERKRAEEALRSSEERFSKAFNASPNPMTISTFIDGRYIAVNDSFIHITGYSREEVVGFTSFDLNLWVKPEDRARIKQILTEQGILSNLELCYLTKLGEMRTGLFSAEIVNLDGEQCILIVMNDITEYKQLEKEMARLERLNLIGEMAAGIAHEIRNPMTTVRGFLQMLGGKQEYRRNKEYFNLMIEELDRANSIITEFLSLAKNKAVDLKIQNLNQIVETLFPLLQANAMVSDKYIKMELEEIPDLLLDEKEIRQLILNLVRNGLEAMSSGGNLIIKTFANGKDMVLSVQDQGKGIDEDLLEKIGTPFFTTKDDGTGLGLAVCYSIAARHKAKINVETGSTGTTFLVRFDCNGTALA